MGLKFSTMMSLFFRKEEVRSCLIGIDAAGKTTLINRLELGEVQNTIPTIGFNVATVEYKNLKLNMFDIGGQTRLRPLWRHYYAGCSAVIFVVDAADRDRLGEAAGALHMALDDDQLRGATLLVYANKQDMPNAMTSSEITEKLKLRDLRGRKWFVQGCSATIGQGVYEGLDWMAANLPKVAK